MHPSIYAFIQLLIHLFIDSFIYSFIYSSIHPFIHPLIHSTHYSFIYLFIYQSIHPSIHEGDRYVLTIVWQESIWFPFSQVQHLEESLHSVGGFIECLQRQNQITHIRAEIWIINTPQGSGIIHFKNSSWLNCSLLLPIIETFFPKVPYYGGFYSYVPLCWVLFTDKTATRSSRYYVAAIRLLQLGCCN